MHILAHSLILACAFAGYCSFLSEKLPQECGNRNKRTGFSRTYNGFDEEKVHVYNHKAKIVKMRQNKCIFTNMG